MGHETLRLTKLRLAAGCVGAILHHVAVKIEPLESAVVDQSTAERNRTSSVRCEKISPCITELLHPKTPIRDEASLNSRKYFQTSPQIICDCRRFNSAQGPFNTFF